MSPNSAVICVRPVRRGLWRSRRSSRVRAILSAHSRAPVWAGRGKDLHRGAGRDV